MTIIFVPPWEIVCVENLPVLRIYAQSTQQFLYCQTKFGLIYCFNLLFCFLFFFFIFGMLFLSDFCRIAVDMEDWQIISFKILV